MPAIEIFAEVLKSDCLKCFFFQFILASSQSIEVTGDPASFEKDSPMDLLVEQADAVVSLVCFSLC